MHKITSSLLVSQCPIVSPEVELRCWFEARWLPRKRVTLLVVVYCSLEGSALVKMFSLGVNLDQQTQVLEVCASWEEGQAPEAAPRCDMGNWVTYVTT